MCEVASKGRTDFTSADPSKYTSCTKERPQHHFGVSKIHFSFQKNTLAHRTNKEHKEEKRFPLLIDTVSYMQPGRILWWSQRSLQFLGDPSLSRLYLSYHFILPLKKQSFSPSPGKRFPPLRIYFHCLALFSAFHLSASNPPSTLYSSKK